MALVWINGFLRDSVTFALATTTTTTGARWDDGFLRDSSGRLVVK